MGTCAHALPGSAGCARGRGRGPGARLWCGVGVATVCAWAWLQVGAAGVGVASVRVGGVEGGRGLPCAAPGSSSFLLADRVPPIPGNPAARSQIV